MVLITRYHENFTSTSPFFPWAFFLQILNFWKTRWFVIVTILNVKRASGYMFIDHCCCFHIPEIVNIVRTKQKQTQDFPEGVSELRRGAPTYYFCKIFFKKCKGNFTSHQLKHTEFQTILML